MLSALFSASLRVAAGGASRILWIPCLAALCAAESALTPDQIEADWRRQEVLRREAGPLTTAEDAAGGVDGVRNGRWGFHTGHEPDPWWEVDLGDRVSIRRIVIWNRCDAFAERTARIRVLLANEEAGGYRQVYEHDGAVFHGHTDAQPLVVALEDTTARRVRLALSGASYLHLDEIEIYGADGTTNLALGKPCDQSSVSQWSVRRAAGRSPAEADVRRVIARGRQLAESLGRLGLDTGPALDLLREVELTLARAEPAGPGIDEVYRRARWAVRGLALANPLLDFSSILFVKRAPGLFPHMSDQHYGWWSRPGGGLYLLEDLRSGSPRLRPLTDALPPGSVSGPDLSHDGRRVLFAYARHYPELAAEPNKADGVRVPEDAYYHLYEINIDGGGLRRLTRGKYDDFDGRYLPDGGIAFLSTRKGTAIQTTQQAAAATLHTDQPASFVRCGGDNWRPVPVFTLHRLSADGAQLEPLSAFENFEWSPSVAADGRLLYTRWDYIDRFNGDFFSLWSANQDGTLPQLVYGNYTARPQVVVEARSIPGSTKLVFTASAHHSITGGALCLLDRNQGTELDAPLTRLTPEVCFPETEGWPEHYYAHPWPLSEEFFLVGWADAPLPPHRFVNDASNPPNAMGLYLLDAFGNLELLYRDPSLSSAFPIPVRSRPRPVTHAPLADWTAPPTGVFLVQNVYQGLQGIPSGRIKQLRIVAVPPKVQPHMNQPELGVSREEPGKYVLGTAPVERDGSAAFRVPAGVPVFFQALDQNGVALQTMRSLTYVMPGQSLSCVGCHEHRDIAPPAGPGPLAFRRPPSRLAPGPEGSWPLRFDRLVQPVLDAHCTRCHQPGSANAEAAAALDLRPEQAWRSLLAFGDNDLAKLALEKDRSFPGEGVTANSRLWKLLTADTAHQEVKLARVDLDRLATWMDTYAQRAGHFSEGQERELEAFRLLMAEAILAPPPGP